MNLDFFTNLANDVKSHSFALQFIDELTEYLNNIRKNVTEKQVQQDLTDFLSTDELISKYKISYTYLGNFYERCNNILKEYSSNKKIYYVSKINNPNDIYDEKNIYKINEYSNGNISSTFYLYGCTLPKIVKEGMLLEKSGNKYIIDIKSTNDISQKFQEVSKEIVNLQENSLKPYRIENDLYTVVEKCSNSVYLQNVNTDIIFEETEFSDDIFNLLHNDIVVRFKNGKYIYEDEITNGWFNSFMSKDELNEFLQELTSQSNYSKIDFTNTTFNISSRDDNYSFLSYGENNKSILKVPNKLISYWADDNSILYYNKETNLFHKV